jgi:hypothetical protein
MFDNPGSHQRMYPNLHTTQSGMMPPAPPPPPAPYGKTINIASTDGPSEIVTTGYLQFYSAISRADHITVWLLLAVKTHRTPSNPLISALVSFRKTGHRQVTICSTSMTSYTILYPALGMRRSKNLPRSTKRRACQKAYHSGALRRSICP